MIKSGKVIVLFLVHGIKSVKKNTLQARWPVIKADLEDKIFKSL
jgi:hypothetical protein